MIVCKCLNNISNSLSFLLQVGQEETLWDTDTYGGWYTAPVEETFNGWGPTRAIDRFNDKDVVPISIDTSLRKACFQHHYLVSGSSSHLGAKVPKIETQKSWFHYLAPAVLLPACFFLAPLLITSKAHAVQNPPACGKILVENTGSSSNTEQVILTEKTKKQEIEKNNLIKQLEKWKQHFLQLQKVTTILRVGFSDISSSNGRNDGSGVGVSLGITQVVEMETRYPIKWKSECGSILQKSNMSNSSLKFYEFLLSKIIYDLKRKDYPNFSEPIPSNPEELRVAISRWMVIKQSYKELDASVALVWKATLPNSLYGTAALKWNIWQGRLSYQGGVGLDIDSQTFYGSPYPVQNKLNAKVMLVVSSDIVSIGGNRDIASVGGNTNKYAIIFKWIGEKIMRNINSLNSERR